MNKQYEALRLAMETMEATLLVGQIPTFAIEQAIQACKEALAEIALDELVKTSQEMGGYD